MNASEEAFSEFADYPPLTKSQEDILREAGLTLFTVQGIEHTLRFLLDFVFPKDAGASLRSLLDGSKDDRKKTLGTLIHELRKRTSVDSTFEDMLIKFFRT